MTKSEHFRKQAEPLIFKSNVTEWLEITNEIGIYSKFGKYGGAY